MKGIFDNLSSEQGTDFFVILEPIRVNDEYMNVLTVSQMPSGPLREFVHRMSFQELSVYKRMDPDDSVFGGKCKLVLCKYNVAFKTRDSFLTERDLPNLYNYMKQNGYSIDHDITKMTFKQHMNVGGITGKPLFYVTSF